MHVKNCTVFAYAFAANANATDVAAVAAML